MNIDSKPIKDRLSYGKNKEDEIRKCLNENYKGYDLLPSSFVQDCKEKTDCWHVTPKGKQCRCAIKARTTKPDILAAIRDPFYGINDVRTKIGRDILYEYMLYITLSPDEKTIRVATGKRCHQIYSEMWEEWVATGDTGPQSSRKLLLASDKHPGCQLWFHRDRWTGHPKILGFIPPDYLKEGKEIKYYPFYSGGNGGESSSS